MIVYCPAGHFEVDGLSGRVVGGRVARVKGFSHYKSIIRFNIFEYCRYHRQKDPDAKIEIQDIGYWCKPGIRSDRTRYYPPNKEHRKAVRKFRRECEKRARRYPMKSEIKVRPHTELPDQNVIEVWYNGEFIATVTGLDGPGVRVISKYINPSTLTKAEVLPMPGVGVVNVHLQIR